MAEITLIAAFIAGFLSVLSPCFLPLLPAFVSYLGGIGFGEGKEKWAREKVFLNTVSFVLGFVLVFSAFGIAINSFLSTASADLTQAIAWVGGLIVIVFGLWTLGLVKVGFLSQERRLSPKKTRYAYFTSFLFGATFAVSWTPCVGPMLGAIFAIALTQPGGAFALLFLYSCGLAMPFLVVGAFTAQANDWIRKHGQALWIFNKLMGALLIVIGILIITGKLTSLGSFGYAEKCLSGK